MFMMLKICGRVCKKLQILCSSDHPILLKFTIAIHSYFFRLKLIRKYVSGESIKIFVKILTQFGFNLIQIVLKLIQIVLTF